MSRHPMVKWAQRSDVLFITIELPDAKDVKLKLEPEGKFFFSATSGVEKMPYEIDMDLFDKVDVNESKASFGLRRICYLVKKAEENWWSRLLKQEGKPPLFLKVDWDKWVDEDEEHEDNPGAAIEDGDFNFSNLNMGGPGLEEFEGDEADFDEEYDESDSDTEEDGVDEAAPCADEVPKNEASSAGAGESEPKA